MSRGQTLRALVNERLAAAAEDIFVLFERTIAEYEEELCRSKEENQRNLTISWTSPAHGLKQEITETPMIKEEPEEQRVKQEEEQLPVLVPEFIAVCVKTEESLLLQQSQSEHQQEKQGEDIRPEPCFHSETRGPYSCSATQMETEAVGDHYNEVQTRDSSNELSSQNKSALETTVHSEHMSGAHGGDAERKEHQCPFCGKRFEIERSLKLHMRVHTGETPYSCSTCEKMFTQKSNLSEHQRIHTGERPYSCPTCEKTFTTKVNLDTHKRTHTGEKPYSCSHCSKRFTQLSALRRHTRTHTGERPYSCLTCEKTFAKKDYLNIHKRRHTGEKPYSCSSCDKRFADSSALRQHSRTHAGEKP